tara:strand:+ start:320 stop:703 length:384 start_codon:yes stop_codon:yes gene_type:complete
MEIILIGAWVFFSFITGLLASGKTVSPWLVFFISLIFSPIIGLIVALASSDKKPPVVQESQVLIEAKKAEYQDNIPLAVRFYEDYLQEIMSKPPGSNTHIRNYRLKQKLEIEEKLRLLKIKLEHNQK